MPLPPTPKITWGDTYQNTWFWAGPPDNPLPRDTARGAWAEADSGARDFWHVRDDRELSLVSRFVPRDATGLVTGYATPLVGVREALLWAQKNRFRYHPDGRNLWRYPMLAVAGATAGVAEGHTILSTAAGTTSTLEDGGQRVNAVFTAANQTVGLNPTIRAPVYAGAVLSATIEARFSMVGAASSTYFCFRQTFYDAAGAAIGGAGFLVMANPPPSGGGYVRYAATTSAAPANAATVLLQPALRSVPGTDASGSGSVVWLRNAQLELGGFTTFVNSELYHECYLVEPHRVERERGGSHYRVDNMVLRDVNGVPFSEY